MRRPILIAIVAAGIVLFLAISAGVARVFSAESAERSAVLDLVRAQSHGDARAMIARIDGCAASGPCRARVRADVRRLAHPGDVTLLRLDPSTGFTLGSATGVARIAWRTPPASRLPIVQCVRVRRDGDVLQGMTIRLLEISRPIGRESECPQRF